MPGDPGATVVTCLRAFYFCTQGCGCNGHPAFPTPSVFRGIGHAKLGRIAPRECGRVFERRRCERSEATKQSIRLSFRDGALAPDPESRDSGFDASHRPGMTFCNLAV